MSLTVLTHPVSLDNPYFRDICRYETWNSGLGRPFVREVKACEYKTGNGSAFYVMIVFSTANKKGVMMVCCAFNWRILCSSEQVPQSTSYPDIITNFADGTVMRMITCRRVVQKLMKMDKVLESNPFTTNDLVWDSFTKMHGLNVKSDLADGGCCEFDVMCVDKTDYALSIATKKTPEELIEIALTSKFARPLMLRAINNELDNDRRFVDDMPSGLSEAQKKLYQKQALEHEREKIRAYEDKALFKSRYIRILYHNKTLDPNGDPVTLKEEVGRGVFMQLSDSEFWDKLSGLCFLKSTAQRLFNSPLNLRIALMCNNAYLSEYNDKDDRFGVILPNNNKMGWLLETAGYKFLLDDTAIRGKMQEDFLAKLKSVLDEALNSTDDIVIRDRVGVAFEMLTIQVNKFTGGILGLMKRLYVKLCFQEIVFPLELHHLIDDLFTKNGIIWYLPLPEFTMDKDGMHPFNLLMKIGLSKEDAGWFL
jgi:hypothetical protein